MRKQGADAELALCAEATEREQARRVGITIVNISDHIVRSAFCSQDAGRPEYVTAGHGGESSARRETSGPLGRFHTGVHVLGPPRPSEIMERKRRSEGLRQSVGQHILATCPPSGRGVRSGPSRAIMEQPCSGAILSLLWRAKGGQGRVEQSEHTPPSEGD